MDLSGKKIAILIDDMFNAHEFWYPYFRLKEAGAKVVVVCAGSKTVYTGKPGAEATADVNVENVSAADFDGVVIPGGYAPDIMRRYPKMVQLVRDIFNSGKVVAAICHAGWMLASAGVLKGKSATSYFAIKDDMVNAGANWIDAEVVIDDNLITSRTPEDLPAFMRAIISALQNWSPA